MADPTTRQDKFNALPEGVKLWLSSPEATARVIALNEELNIAGPRLRIIPKLILLLVIKEIDPRDFINELSRELGVPLIDAKKITDKIEESILRPVRNQLIGAGIDINLLHALEPGAPSREQPAIETKPMLETTTVPPPRVEPPMVQPAEVRPVPPKVPSIEPKAEAGEEKPAGEDLGEAKPFILHEEIPVTKPSEIKPPMTLKVPITIKPSAPKITHKPLEAITPKESENQSNNKPRKVHYSNYKTQLK